MIGKCELCKAEEQHLNFHHLIPRKLHGNKLFLKLFTKDYMRNTGINICKYTCHREIHNKITEKEMGLNYNTLDKLLEHPEVKKYIEWKQKRK